MAYSNDEIRQLENLKNQTRNFIVQKYQNKTDAELEAIIAHNAQAVYGQSLVEGYKTLAESEACRQIIITRKEDAVARASRKIVEQSAFKQAFREWNENLNSRRMAALINLPTATSYHGQLVAAILSDEDGLSAQEICQWSEELTALSDNKVRKLLTDLIAEGILVIDDQEKYHLASVCDESLLPVDVVRWAKCILQFRHNRVLENEQESFLAALAVSPTPLSEYDWFEITGNTKALKEAQEEHYIRQSTISSLIRLVVDGILLRKPLAGTELNLYYLPMLGEGK